MTFWKQNWHDLEEFQVMRYPKIVIASYINIISASENALYKYIVLLYHYTYAFLSHESIPGTLETSSATEYL